MDRFSDYIVYVDESGDHGLAEFGSEFPVFVLTFCIFRKEEYIDRVVPAFQRIKFKYFGHDMIVFHERDIRKAAGRFTFLTDGIRREQFMKDVNDWVEASPFAIIAIAIRKTEFAAKHADGRNPYNFAMRLGLERVQKHLEKRGQSHQLTHIVFESRGKREDNDLELEFRRVCDGQNYKKDTLNFQILFPGKQVNSTGLQLADLIARPIARHVLNPNQSNRAFQVIEKKLDRSPWGVVAGYGLKCYP